jgi:histidinol-phosphate phosphatase family protein
MSASVDLVIPTCGRSSLERLLSSAGRERPEGARVIVVDDRPRHDPALEVPEWAELVHGRSAGPAAARNRGWRASSAEWVVFLDDDTFLPHGWGRQLAADLECPNIVAGCQGRVRVPRPAGRKPTDGERALIGLESARFATADMAYRRDVLALVGGFDERFPRPYREDSDLALRVLDAGYRIERGERITMHRLQPDPARSSLRRQAGNRDDVAMRALHGRSWRRRCGAPAGRLRRHAVVTAAGLSAAALLAAGRRRGAALAASAWLTGTAELAWARIAPGPLTPAEVTAMLATSLAIPPLAVAHTLAGAIELRRRLSPAPAAVLFDRDGTLIVDVPHNGDPRMVRPMPGALEAVRRLRFSGVPIAVVTNQACIGRGLVDAADVEAVNQRVEELLGPLGQWFVCPHDDADACACRKPAPGMIRAAAAALGVPASAVVVIGDTASDMAAAASCGARGVLVPNDATLADEVCEATEVASSLPEAVDLLLGAAA